METDTIPMATGCRPPLHCPTSSTGSKTRATSSRLCRLNEPCAEERDSLGDIRRDSRLPHSLRPHDKLARRVDLDAARVSSAPGRGHWCKHSLSADQGRSLVALP